MIIEFGDMRSLEYEIVKKVHGITQIQIETHLTKHWVYMASIEQHTGLGGGDSV